MLGMDIMADAITGYYKKKGISNAQEPFEKVAVTYQDVVQMLNRLKKSGKIIEDDYVRVLQNHPGPVGKVSRKLVAEGNLAEGLGPVSLPKRHAVAMGVDKKYHNKIFMPNPHETPHIYGNFLNKDKKKTLDSIQGVFAAHEMQELRNAARLPRTRAGLFYNHMSLSQVLGRADNNFIAAAADTPTREAANFLKKMREARGETEAIKQFDLNKPKPIPRQPGQKAIPGLARLTAVQQGKKVAPIETMPSGFELGKRKISRKEALVKYFKEIGIDPHVATNPKLKRKFRKELKGMIKAEDKGTKKFFDEAKRQLTE